MKLTKKEILIGIICLLSGFMIYLSISKLIGTTAHEHNSSSANHLTDSHNHEQIWTCSMHPQIRQQEPGKCPICGMDLIPLQKNTDEQASPFVYTMTQEAIALANVQTLKVGQDAPQRDIQLTGRIQVNEQSLAVITADYPGRIESLAINFTGQQINQGQVIASIYSPELITAQKELLEAGRTKDINPALYDAAKEKLRLWKLTDDQIQQIEQSEQPITSFDILAHKSGIVISRNVAKGDYIGRGEVLFDIADLSSVWVIFDAYEADLAAISIGDKISFTVAAYPGKDFTARVTFIDPSVDPQTRTVAVRAQAPNPDGRLKPQMFVRGNVSTTAVSADKAIMVPRTAVLWTGKRSVVYVKVPDLAFPAFEMREVTLGSRIGESYIIEKGLETGEEIVVNGAFAIDAAAQLNGNFSMMNRPVDIRLEVPRLFREQLTRVAQAYFDVKNALVESDFDKAQSAAEQVKSQLSLVDMGLVKGEAHDQWMKIHNELLAHLSGFLQAKDIEEQRTHFEAISNKIIEIAEVYGLTMDKVYKAYCPMALDDQGAFWLSEFEAIKNPYFGEAMLRCGSVEAVIEKDKPIYRDELPAAPPEEHVH